MGDFSLYDNMLSMLEDPESNLYIYIYFFLILAGSHPV